MPNHKLLELNKIIEERIESLREEVEIATSVNLSPMYLSDRTNEIDFLRWTTTIIRWILDQAVDGRNRLEQTRIQIELEEIKKFENVVHERIQESEIELEDSDTSREREVLVNEIDTLRCVLGHLLNLKFDNAKVRANGIAETNYDNQQTSSLKKQLEPSKWDPSLGFDLLSQKTVTYCGRSTVV